MKHGKMLRRLTALALSAAMAVSVEFAANPAENVTLDKSASGWEGDQTTVTLSIGATQTTTAADVVFVLDKSTSTDVRDEAIRMLGELQEEGAERDLDIKVGAVIFNRTADNEGYVVDLKPLNESSVAELEEVFDKDLSSGTNIEAGIRKGIAMLEGDSSVPEEDKHLVLVSDGITYIWGESEPVKSVYNQRLYDKTAAVDNIMYLSTVEPNPESVKDLDTWMDKNGSEIEALIEEYETNYTSGTIDQSAEGYNDLKAIPERDDDFTALECAIYKSALAWKDADSNNWNLYAYATQNSRYPWGPNFVENLSKVAGGKSGPVPDSVDGMFDTVKNSILYEIQEGTVTDTIGEHFNWVGMDTVDVRINDKSATPKKINDNSVSFGEKNEYVVSYATEGDKEVITWNINVPVESDQKIELVYKLSLDRDSLTGDETFVDTNESATLEYTSSDGSEGKKDFEKPTLPLDGETPVPDPDPEPTPDPDPGDDNDKPSGGSGDNDDRYEGADLTVVKVDEDGETIESNARFRIYKEQGSKTMWYKGNQSWSEDEEDAWIFNTSVGDGSFTAYDLKPGTYYIVEISAPEGYDLAEEPLEVEVESRDVTVEFVNSGDGVVTTPTKPVPDTGR